MTTMLEKMARAIYANRHADDPWDECSARRLALGMTDLSASQETAMRDARAALLAMRPRTFSDLPEEGLLAGESIIGSGAGGYSGAADVFAAMIDHILNEGEGK